MTVDIRIDRLVLDGLRLGPHEGEAVSRALQRELTRLVCDRGLHVSSGAAVPRLDLGSIDVDRRPGSGAIGERIAEALYGGLAPATDARGPRT